MKFLNTYESFDFKEEDFDFEEENLHNNDFEYVSTNDYINNANIYLSLKEIKNGSLKLFDIWTNVWKPSSFRPLNNEELNRMKDDNMWISFYDKHTTKWIRRGYRNFIKLYPKFEI